MITRTITAAEFAKIVSANERISVLDVRTDLECRALKLSGDFIHIPLHRLNPQEFAKEYGAAIGDRPLYILCRSGGRAQKAAEALSDYLASAIVVVGGLDACCACGVAVMRTEILSLERQVRIAAGFLVLSGVLLGNFVDSGFYIVSGLVGAGLIFAGITNWCGMAMLLANAPWNRRQIGA